MAAPQTKFYQLPIQKFPIFSLIRVEIDEKDPADAGNKVIKAMTDAGVKQDFIDAFTIEASSHDPEHMIETCRRTVTCTAVPEPITRALEIAFDYGQVDGAHHKAWVIDQMVQALTGDRYDRWVEEYTDDGEYEWDTGIAP